jgi:uncharacterized membrane protein
MSFIAKGLQVFGALALAAVLAVFGYITYSFVFDSDHTNKATQDGVQFIFLTGVVSKQAKITSYLAASSHRGY